jgi:hypothetical protein
MMAKRRRAAGVELGKEYQLGKSYGAGRLHRM